MRGREERDKENGAGKDKLSCSGKEREIAAASQWIPEALPQIRTKGEKGERGGKTKIERRERRKRREKQKSKEEKGERGGKNKTKIETGSGEAE